MRIYLRLLMLVGLVWGWFLGSSNTIQAQMCCTENPTWTTYYCDTWTNPGDGICRPGTLTESVCNYVACYTYGIYQGEGRFCTDHGSWCEINDAPGTEYCDNVCGSPTVTPGGGGGSCGGSYPACNASCPNPSDVCTRITATNSCVCRPPVSGAFIRNRIWRDLDNDGNRDENEEVYHGNSCGGDGDVDMAGFNLFHNSAYFGEHNTGCMVGPTNPVTTVSVGGTGEDFITLTLPEGYEIVSTTLGPGLSMYNANTVRSYELGNGTYTDAYWLIRPVPLNCSNISGPATIVRGQSGTFEADFISGLGNLRSGFFNDPLSTPSREVNPLLPDWTYPPATDTYIHDSRSWTPATAGTFNVCCRAVGNGRECRPSGYDSGYDTCSGPNTCMTVNVITPTPTTPPPTTAPSPTPTPNVIVRTQYTDSTPVNVSQLRYVAYNSTVPAYQTQATLNNANTWNRQSYNPVPWSTYTHRGMAACYDPAVLTYSSRTTVPPSTGIFSGVYTSGSLSCVRLAWPNWNTGTREVTFSFVTPTPSPTPTTGPTPTPYVQVFLRNQAGTLVSSEQLARVCNGARDSVLNGSSSLTRTISACLATVGGAVNPAEPGVIIGVTPVPSGGAYSYDGTTWSQYTWSPRWNTGVRSATFIVATPTPAATYTISGTVFNGNASWNGTTCVETAGPYSGVNPGGASTVRVGALPPDAVGLLGDYSISGVSAGINVVTLNNVDTASYTCVCPVDGGGGNCPQSVNVSGNTTVDFYVLSAPVIPDPWWQTKYGDILSGLSLTNSNMPLGSSLSESIAGVKDKGVLLYNNAPSLGLGAITNSVQTAYAGTEENYTYFWNLLEMPTTGVVDDISNHSTAVSQPLGNPLNSSKLTGNERAYVSNGDLYIDAGSPWSLPAGHSWVVFVNGNLTLSGSPGIPASGGRFLMFVVSGSIIFNPEVTGAEGIYVANGTINLPTGGGVDVPFNGKGTFIGWTGVTLARDIQAANPSEVFEYDQNLILNAPGALKKANFVWSEVAP